jgi:hypothetical protein
MAALRAGIVLTARLDTVDDVDDSGTGGPGRAPGEQGPKSPRDQDFEALMRRMMGQP